MWGFLKFYYLLQTTDYVNEIAAQETMEALGGTDIMPKHADACRSRYVCILK